MRLFVAATFALALTWAVSAEQRGTAIPRPAAPPTRDAAVPFKPGETLTYDVSWSQFITAGTAVARVVEKKASYGSTAYYIVADGRPLPLVARFYPLYYKMDSLLDTVTLLSQYSSLYQEQKSGKRLATTRFDRTTRVAQFEQPDKPDGKGHFAIPTNVQDGLATLYSLRGHAFKAGERLTVPVADDGSIYSVTFEVAGPERVRVPFGENDAWNLNVTVLNSEGKPAANNVRSWISTDARHLPLKLQADLPVGSFVLGLRDAQQQ